MATVSQPESLHRLNILHSLSRQPALVAGIDCILLLSGVVTEAGTIDTASDSYIVSTGQEDIHSAGNTANANLMETIDMIARVIAVELICCARATRQTGLELPDGLAAARQFVESTSGLAECDET